MDYQFILEQKLPFKAYELLVERDSGGINSCGIYVVDIAWWASDSSVGVTYKDGRRKELPIGALHATVAEAQKELNMVVEQGIEKNVTLAFQAEADFKVSLPQKYSDLKDRFEKLMTLLSETNRALGSEIYKTKKCPADSVFNRQVFRCVQSYIERNKEPQGRQESEPDVDASPAHQAPSA